MESSTSSNRPFQDKKQVLLDLNVAFKEDSDLLSDETSKGELRKVEPEWLESFVNRTFFDPCSEHAIWRNEKNKYCIDCNMSLCNQCHKATTHKGHMVLKLYRYVRKDVTPVSAIAQLIDCSEIQPYKCNKQQTLALTSLPSTGSKLIFSDEQLCRTCKRKMVGYNVYCYCSISCKVDAFIKKKDDDSPPFLALKLEQPNTAVDQPVQEAEQEPEPREPTLAEMINRKRNWPSTRLEELAEVASQELAKANQEHENNLRKRKKKGAAKLRIN